MAHHRRGLMERRRNAGWLHKLRSRIKKAKSRLSQRRWKLPTQCKVTVGQQAVMPHWLLG